MLKSKFNSYTFFPGQHWNHTWERQHEIATRLANLIGEPIKICKPLGTINYNPLSIKFIQKIKNYKLLDSDNSLANPLSPYLNLVGGFYCPFHNSVIAKLNFLLLNRPSQMRIEKNNFFWSTYINPTIYEYFKRSSFKIYDIAERRSKNPLISNNIKILERKVIKEADIVFVDNHAALEDFKNLNSNIYYIPQGVNIEDFKPNYQAHEERKYIGYIGNFHNAIDYDFLEKLIQLNSNELFLFVGRIMSDKATKLMSYSNVEHVGEVQKNKLNLFLQKMKIGLIPYKIDDVTIGVYPTKLFEYLASGVPVISTSLPEVVQYANTDFLKIINQPQNLKHINFEMKHVQEIVNENTWDNRFNDYIKYINQCLK